MHRRGCNVQDTVVHHDVGSHLMQTKTSGIFDFGGGDVSLRTVIDMAPTLAEDMIGAGVEPIACYCIGPSQDDLTSLGSLEEGDSGRDRPCWC